MFDRINLGPRSMDVSVHQTEQRAPTDESVRLLKEFEDKARDKVVESLRLTNNTVEAVIHRFDDPMDQTTKFFIYYKINGEKREVRCSVDDYKSEVRDRLDAIWTAVAEDMTRFMLGKAVGKETVR